MPELTKRAVEAAEPKAADYFFWHDDLPGFGIRIFPSGRKRYVVQYHPGRRPRRISLGPTTALPYEQARTRTTAIIVAVKAGDDPAARRDADQDAITVKKLAERFDKEHISIRVKASTGKGYRLLLDKTILRALGRLRVIEVTRADIAELHHYQSHIPYKANRCLEVVSKIFSLAETWRLRPDGSNQRKHIKNYAEEKRERFLSPAAHCPS